MSESVEWRADRYEAQALPHPEWADRVAARLDLRGDETVLDAGCGTGLLAARLLERLPRGRVVGVDESEAMLDRARQSLGETVHLIQSSLLELDLDQSVDAIASSAVFHWIPDHQRLFERLHAALRPGGQLEAQFGGIGNIAEIERAIEALAGDERFAAHLRTDRQAWNYASVDDTERRLRRGGFEDARAWLEPWPVTPPDPGAYLETVILPWHLDRLPNELHDAFVDAVLGSAPRPFVANYVRLNISARRPA